MFPSSEFDTSLLTDNSRQIRPPIYSLKQTKLRKRRVIRYAILYFVLLVVFLAIIVGPIVAGKQLKLDVKLPMELLQPTGFSNNDTTNTPTGTCIQGVCPEYQGGDAANTGSGDSADASATDEAARRFRRYMAY
jgi:1,3-beta-glucan synthase